MENSLFYKYMFFTLDVNKKQVLKRILFIAPLGIIFCFAFIKFVVSSKLYFWSIHEDGLVEYGTFFTYFIALLFALSIASRFYKNKHTLYGFLYFILSIGLFYIAMEEISWGQRIFGIKTPEFLLSYNDQKEMNTHNLLTRYYLHGLYILVGFYGAFIRLVLPKKVKTTYRSEVNLFAPDYYLFFYFFPAFLFYFYYDYLSIIETYFFGDNFIRGRFIRGKDQEPLELLLSFGFLLFVLINKYRQNTGKMITFLRNAGIKK